MSRFTLKSNLRRTHPLSRPRDPSFCSANVLTAAHLGSTASAQSAAAGGYWVCSVVSSRVLALAPNRLRHPLSFTTYWLRPDNLLTRRLVSSWSHASETTLARYGCIPARLPSNQRGT